MERSNRNFSTTSCFSHPTLTATLKLVTEIVTFILKNRRWMGMVIYITVRIIKIFAASVAIKRRVSEVSRSKSKTVNMSKNMQSCCFVDWTAVC